MARASTASKKRIKFQIKAESGKVVSIAGTFNDWNPETNKLAEKGQTGVYSTILSLAKGRYEYKFIVDGTWCCEPGRTDSDCADCVPNPFGTMNRVIEVYGAAKAKAGAGA